MNAMYWSRWLFINCHRFFYKLITCAVPLSGTGGQMEAYAILSWLSVNESLSYLLRGQVAGRNAEVHPSYASA